MEIPEIFFPENVTFFFFLFFLFFFSEKKGLFLCFLLVATYKLRKNRVIFGGISGNFRKKKFRNFRKKNPKFPAEFFGDFFILFYILRSGNVCTRDENLMKFMRKLSEFRTFFRKKKTKKNAFFSFFPKFPGKFPQKVTKIRRRFFILLTVSLRQTEKNHTFSGGKKAEFPVFFGNFRGIFGFPAPSDARGEKKGRFSGIFRGKKVHFFAFSGNFPPLVKKEGFFGDFFVYSSTESRKKKCEKRVFFDTFFVNFRVFFS